MGYLEENKETVTLVLIISVIIAGLILVGFISYQVIGVVNQEEFEGEPLPEQDQGQGDNSTYVYDCFDSIDNDGDGFIDLNDFGCVNISDDSEVNNGNTECTDGLDNDGDNKIDQADINCDSRSDDMEGIITQNLSCNLINADWNVSSAEFGEIVRMEIRSEYCENKTFDVFVNMSVEGGNETKIDEKLNLNFTNNRTYIDWEVNDSAGTTGFNFILPLVLNFSFVIMFFSLKNFANKNLGIVVLILALVFFTFMFGGYLFLGDSEVRFSPGDTDFYFVVNVDGSNESIVSDGLSLSFPSNESQCENGLDDDGDGKIDNEDAGCWDTGAYNESDNDEADIFVECSNYFDDDGDGNIDYPIDLGCTSLTDDDEFNPICGDGMLNQVGEQCDDGNSLSEDGCSSSCSWEFNITLNEPAQSQEFSTNESLPLNFSLIYPNEFLASCFYQVNETAFPPLTCDFGDNFISFDVPGAGNYSLTIFSNFSNESLGASLVLNRSVNFSVILK